MAATKGSSNDHEILELSRSAALESAANLLQGIAEGQKLKRRAEAAFEDRRKEEKDRKGGDFLFDMLRLNARYLNELAKLSDRHKGFALRALENFYALANPGVRNGSATELELSRQKMTSKFVVQNDVNPEEDHVTLEWVPPLGPKDQSFTFEFQGSRRRPKAAGCIVKIPIAFGLPKVITLNVDLSDYLDRRYRTEILIKLPSGTGDREHIRRIPVLIDARKPKEKEPASPEGSHD